MTDTNRDSGHILRTADSRFAGLPDFPFEPHYVDVPDARFGHLRMAFIDEGRRDAPPVLMLHGMPTWSFLYRKLIRPIAQAGFRAIAVDHIGFGRSDKPADRAHYTYDRHVAWTRACVEALGIPHAGSSAAPVVTVSVGVTQAHCDRDTKLETLFQRADAALYRAKRTRNAVVMDPDEDAHIGELVAETA